MDDQTQMPASPTQGGPPVGDADTSGAVPAGDDVAADEEKAAPTEEGAEKAPVIGQPAGEGAGEGATPAAGAVGKEEAGGEKPEE